MRFCFVLSHLILCVQVNNFSVMVGLVFQWVEPVLSSFLNQSSHEDAKATLYFFQGLRDNFIKR